jgi:RNA polymerase-binding transcription factor DksA
MSRIAEEAERRLRDRRREMLLDSFDESEQQDLRELDAALGRIASGEFGRCERCGGAIGTQRLRALPEARYCIAGAGKPAPLAVQG